MKLPLKALFELYKELDGKSVKNLSLSGQNKLDDILTALFGGKEKK